MKGDLEFTEVLQAAKRDKNFHKAGAIAAFIGVVRGLTENRQVEKLELEAYEKKANKVLGKICDELSMREGIVDVQIHHLLGEFKVGEELVYVLVVGAHRSKVFPVLEEAVERYKTEVPIFKKEYVINKSSKMESYWVSEQETRK